MRYPADPRKPESVGLDFYNGMPGVVAFYAALHHATQDPAWFAAAEPGGRYLLHAVATEGDQFDGGLYTGLAGISYSLHCLSRSKPNTQRGDEARRLIDPVGARARTTDSWDLISGLAGTGLFLLSAGSLRRNYPNFSHGTAGISYFLAPASSFEPGRTRPAWRLPPPS